MGTTSEEEALQINKKKKEERLLCAQMTVKKAPPQPLSKYTSVCVWQRKQINQPALGQMLHWE